jgi:altronate dehydratase
MTGRTIAEAGAELTELMIEVANGRATKPELNRTELFAIHTLGAAF